MTQSPTGPDEATLFEAAEAAPVAANLVGGGARVKRGLQAGGGYSRFVVGMKVLLPFLAVGLIVLIAIWPRLKSDSAFRIGFSSASFSDATGPGMDNARYVGTDENRQPYSVTADLARLATPGGSEVDLELPKADLTLEDGSWLVLTADTGSYMRDTAVLNLLGGVNLFHDTGYEITTEALTVYLKAGVAEGHVPLNGHGPFGELKAQGIKLIEKGQVIYFTGPAQLVLYASQGAN